MIARRPGKTAAELRASVATENGCSRRLVLWSPLFRVSGNIKERRGNR